MIKENKVMEMEIDTKINTVLSALTKEIYFSINRDERGLLDPIHDQICTLPESVNNKIFALKIAQTVEYSSLIAKQCNEYTRCFLEGNMSGEEFDFLRPHYKQNRLTTELIFGDSAFRAAVDAGDTAALDDPAKIGCAMYNTVLHSFDTVINATTERKIDWFVEVINIYREESK